MAHFGFKPFSCDTCGMAFSQKNSLKYHQQMHLIKAMKKIFSCERCGLKGKTPRWMRKHEKNCTGEKLKCEICGKEFERVCALLSHKKIHTEESPNYGKYFCDKCPRKFEFALPYTKHIKICKGVFPCDICNTKFRVQENLQKHKEKYHNKENKPFIENDKQDNMEKDHEITNEDRLGEFLSGLIACDLCDIVFTNIADFNDHKEDHQSSISFPCDICSKSFLSIDDYTLHISSNVHIVNVAAATDIQSHEESQREENFVLVDEEIVIEEIKENILENNEDFINGDENNTVVIEHVNDNEIKEEVEENPTFSVVNAGKDDQDIVIHNVKSVKEEHDNVKDEINEVEEVEENPTFSVVNAG